MTQLHSLLVYAHIAVGSVALILFWAPVLVRKGSRAHVRTGRIYVVCMHIVVITAFAASVLVLIDPLAVRAPDAVLNATEAERLASRFRRFSLFLLMLSILIFASLRHGTAALRARREPSVMRSPLHRATLVALGACALVVAWLGIREQQVLLITFGGIGILGAVSMIRDTLRRELRRGDYLFMHLNGLIGTGIGAYTGFFAFGGSRLLADILVGQWQVIAWLTPPIIGTIAIQRLKRPYVSR